MNANKSAAAAACGMEALAVNGVVTAAVSINSNAPATALSRTQPSL
jgi:hypothetical protein